MSDTTENTPVVEALRQVVAESYALIGQTHVCHWNVRGPGFFSLHTAFEEQYTELFTAVDEIAERLRALGALAPGGLGNLATMAGYTEIAEDADAKAMVSHLVDLHGKLVASLQKARDLAAEADDSETEDLMIARSQVHEKTIWMMKSYLG
ncbi:MAG: DNA starvation/stationary phase protection protein [Verrucomicrobiales bacterium]|nr:DNA starvation/stationary phase protection protein [Verrucomicrobiales bacterium]